MGSCSDLRKRMSPLPLLLLLFLLCVSCVCSAPSTPLLDVVVLGDGASESLHSFHGSASIAGSLKAGVLPLSYRTSLTYRQIAADASHTVNQTFTGDQSSMLNLTLRVDPSQSTYLTLKMYGSDNQTGAIFLYWKPPQPNETLAVGEPSAAYPGCVYIGSGLYQLGWYYPLPLEGYNGYAQIDLSNSGGQAFPRQFYYDTLLLPSYMTRGLSEMTFLLGGWGEVNGYFYPFLGPLNHPLKPIYRVYTHIDPYFVPMPSPTNDVQALDFQHFDLHTLTSPSTRPPPLPLWQYQDTITAANVNANLSLIRRDFDASVSGFLGDGPTNGLQIFGSAWNATLDINNPGKFGATPAVLYGAIGVPFSLTTANLSYDAWLQRAQASSTIPNNTPLTFFGVLALGYNTAWSKFYQKEELVHRVVAGLDFYMHQQGSNGGMLAYNATTPWCGAPHRTSQCGSPLDGVGPFSLGTALVSLKSALDRLGLLDDIVDYNLDGKTLIPRRQGWWWMFNSSITGTLPQSQRGGCPSQDLLQIEGVLLSNIAAATLLPLPAPLSNTQVQVLLNQTLGWADQARFPQYGPFFTPQGMAMECFGTLGGGGFEMNYGSLSISLMTNIILALSDSEGENDRIHQRLRDYFHMFARFINLAYIENDSTQPLGSPTNPTSLVGPYAIDTRGDFMADRSISTDLQSAIIYLAGTDRDPSAVRVLQLQLLVNNWPSARFAPTSADTDNAFQFLTTYPFLELSLSAAFNESSEWFSVQPLPSELSVLVAGEVVPTVDNAWMDVVAGAVQIKFGDELVYLNMNYRHQPLEVDGVVKLERKTQELSEVALVSFEAEGGFFGVWIQQFGPYLLAVNRGTTTQRETVRHPQTIRGVTSVSGVYVDLKTGQQRKCGHGQESVEWTLPAGEWAVIVFSPSDPDMQQRNRSDLLQAVE